MENNVLLTYGWVRSTYAALRNLNNHGVRTHISDVNRVGMCQFSRLKASFGLYRSHYVDELAFVDDVLKLCEKHNINLILPSHNETEVLAKHQSKLGDDLGRLLPVLEHSVLFNNKAKSYDYVESLGLSVPPRVFYKNTEELMQYLKSNQQYVIKILTGNSSKGVYYSDSPKKVIETVEKLIKQYSLQSNRYPQVEEVVHGEGWGCSVLYWHGEPIADFCHRRLREKISTGGTSTLREQRDHNEMLAATHKIFSNLGWHGLAMCEFKVCEKTGKYWFIEVNPRMWGSISLAINSGVEFPYLAYLCATQGPDVARAHHDRNIKIKAHKARWLLGDMSLAAKNILRLKVPTAVSLMTEKADSNDDFYWDDTPAFCGQVLAYVKNSAFKLSLNPEEKGMIR